MNHQLIKLSILTILEIREISGGKEFCDCAVEGKDLIISARLESEKYCEDWCCDSKHKEFTNLRGRFYMWDIESGLDKANDKWKKC